MYVLPALALAGFVASLLIAYQNCATLNSNVRRLFVAALLSVATVGLGCVVLFSARNILHPPQWDFLIFWIDGRVAAEGLNFYDPAHALRLAQPFHPSPDFVAEALSAPFQYPPPSILWFWPLGWFEIHTAALIWHVAHLAALLAAVPLLAITILRQRTALACLLAGGILSMMWATYLNVKFSQTLFLLLLFVILFFRNRDSIRGGVWLGMAILVKPVAAPLAVYLVVKKRWTAAVGVLVPLIAATALTLAISGPAVFHSYLFELSFHALPMTLFTEMENQSLLAWVLRLTGATNPGHTGYLVLAGLLTLITVWRIWRAADSDGDWAAALLLLLALLIYPGALRSYSVLLAIPILILVRNGFVWPVAAAYGLMVLGRDNYTVLATALLWIVFMSGSVAGVIPDSQNQLPEPAV